VGFIHDNAALLRQVLTIWRYRNAEASRLRFAVVLSLLSLAEQAFEGYLRAHTYLMTLLAQSGAIDVPARLPASSSCVDVLRADSDAFSTGNEEDHGVRVPHLHPTRRPEAKQHWRWRRAVL
jgi:hypothetical protein